MKKFQLACGVVLSILLLAFAVSVNGDCASSCSTNCAPLVAVCNEQCTNHAHACSNGCNEQCNRQCSSGTDPQCQSNCLTQCRQQNCASQECNNACSGFSTLCNSNCVSNCNTQQESGALANCTQCDQVSSQCTQLYTQCNSLINYEFRRCIYNCDPFCCVNGNQNNCNHTCLGFCGATCIETYDITSDQCEHLFEMCQSDIVRDCQQQAGCLGSQCEQNCLRSCGSETSSCLSNCNSLALSGISNCQSVCDGTINCPDPRDPVCTQRCLVGCLGSGVTRSRSNCAGGSCFGRESACVTQCEDQNNC